MSEAVSKLNDRRIDILIDGELFTSYKFGEDQSKPWFFPVNGQCGESITDESPEDSPHHHSLWLGCDKVNGHDFWSEAPGHGRIVVTDEPQLLNEGEAAGFRHSCDWLTGGGVTLIREVRTVKAWGGEDDDGRLMDFETSLEALEDIIIEPTENALFSVRVAPSISVDNGGVVHNAMSDEGEEETFGETAFWCDYSGPIADQINGITIYDHSDNPWHPTHWFTRDYGFMSPSSLHFMNVGWKIAAGEKVTLRYRILVHAGDVYDGNSAVYWGEYAAGY